MSRSHAPPAPHGQRQLRVGEAVRHALADLFMRGSVHDPVLADAPLTISEVRMSRDLRRATVFLTELGSDRLRPELKAALERAQPYLRGEVARRVNLKYAPTLDFELDASFGEAARIGALIAAERSHFGLTDEDDDGAR
jgi:ribosome-binding factor A